MAITEEQQQRMATQKREAARRRAALALRDSSKQSSLPASAITEQQRQRSEENKCRALQLLKKQALQLAASALRDSSKQSSLPASAITEQQRQRSKENKRRALKLRQQSKENERCALQLRNVQASQIVVPSKFTRFSHSAPIGQASALTEHQKRRMEHNCRLALERRKKGAKNGDVTQSPTTMRSAQHVVSSTTMTPRPITDLQRKRMESNRRTALEKKNKGANNGFVTPPPSTSRSQSFVPTACKRPKITADFLFSNGSILKVHGVHHRETNVLLGGAVHLVREPDNVSFYLCFLI